MARGGKGIAQWGEAALKPVLSSSTGSSGDFVLCQSVRDKGQKPKLGSRVEPHPSLPEMWDWLSGDVPHSPKDWWPNKPLEGHRAAIVAALQEASCRGPEG